MIWNALILFQLPLFHKCQNEPGHPVTVPILTILDIIEPKKNSATDGLDGAYQQVILCTTGPMSCAKYR